MSFTNKPFSGLWIKLMWLWGLSYDLETGLISVWFPCIVDVHWEPSYNLTPNEVLILPWRLVLDERGLPILTNPLCMGSQGGVHGDVPGRLVFYAFGPRDNVPHFLMTSNTTWEITRGSYFSLSLSFCFFISIL